MYWYALNATVNALVEEEEKLVNDIARNKKMIKIVQEDPAQDGREFKCQQRTEFFLFICVKKKKKSWLSVMAARFLGILSNFR